MQKYGKIEKMHIDCFNLTEKNWAKCENKKEKQWMKFDCFNKCLTVGCNFLQCDYCQIGNVSMNGIILPFNAVLIQENGSAV